MTSTAFGSAAVGAALGASGKAPTRAARRRLADQAEFQLAHAPTHDPVGGPVFPPTPPAAPSTSPKERPAAGDAAPSRGSGKGDGAALGGAVGDSRVPRSPANAASRTNNPEISADRQLAADAGPVATPLDESAPNLPNARDGKAPGPGASPLLSLADLATSSASSPPGLDAATAAPGGLSAGGAAEPAAGAFAQATDDQSDSQPSPNADSGSLQPPPIVGVPFSMEPDPAASAPATAPSPSAVQQVLDRLSRTPTDTTVVLRLNPPLLGAVTLRIVADGGQRIHLRVQAERPEVASALEAGWGQLAGALRARGLTPQSFTVAVANPVAGESTIPAAIQLNAAQLDTQTATTGGDASDGRPAPGSASRQRGAVAGSPHATEDAVLSIESPHYLDRWL